MGILDDNYDPLDRIGRIPGLDGGGGGRRPVYRQPLPPDQLKSVGQKALDTGASGLSYVLGTLDKPGQAARGVLAGHGVAALKHLVPFSDSVGLTTEADHVSGRDLTDSYGLTSKHDKGWGAWGAGLAADIATDPLTYTTFGAKHALTPIGSAVQKTGALKGWKGAELLKGFNGVEPALLKAGKTASDVTHAIDQGKRIATGAAAATGVHADQPLSSLVRFGLPFGGPGANIGTGARAQKVAGALDSAGDYLKFGNPVGRAVGSLFDSTRHGAVDRITQEGAQKYLDPSLHALQAQARKDRGGVIKELDPLVGRGVPVRTQVGVRHQFTTMGPSGSLSVTHDTPAEAIAEAERLVGLTSHGPVKPGSLVGTISTVPSYKDIPKKFPEHEITDAARAVAEGVTHQFDPALVAQVRPVGDQIRDIGKRQLGEARQAGAPLKEQGDAYRDYVHRSATTENPNNLQVGQRSKNMFPVTSGADISVDPLYRDIPGATHRINDWFGRFAGDADKTKVSQAVLKDLLNDFNHTGKPLTKAISDGFGDKAVAMSERLASSRPSRLATPTSRGGLFTPDLTADVTQRGAQHARTVSSAHGAIGILGDNARPIVPGDGLIPVTSVLKKLGLATTKADHAAGTPMEGALVQAYKALAKQGAGKVDPFLIGKRKTLAKAVGGYGVTREQFDQITKAYGKWSAPEQIKSSLGALDSFTNAFKGLAYPIWIPAHVRNAGTASVNNATRGVGLGDYLDQLHVMTGRGSRDLSRIHPSLAGLKPADQVDKLRELQYSGANIFGGHGMNEEIAGNVTQALKDGKRFTPQVPGSDRVGPTGNLAGDTANLVLKEGVLGSLGSGLRTVRDSVGGLLDPNRRWGQSLGENLGIRGVGGATADTLPAVKAGRKAGTNIEDFFRGAQFNRELRTGATPEVASDAINRLHFDYDALTPFEKNVMRRAVPFYTFMKKNLPLQLDTAIHTPGVINAQYKPFHQEGRENGYVPQYLNSGVAIPLGPEQDGKRQYLSKLGLPAEEAFERLHFKNGLPDIRSTALDYLGSMNPVIKAPLEQIFDTQFHTGRKLSDLKVQGAAKSIGQAFGEDNPQLLGQVMANSPFTRFFSSADKLTDPRKAWWQKGLNLATGLRVSDVDTDKQRAIDTRSVLEGMMQGHPNLSRYSNFYVKPEDAHDLSPEEIEMMRAYSAIQENAKAYAEQNRRIGVQR